MSLGVRNAESAAFLLAYCETHAIDEGRLAEFLHDAARYAAEDQFVDVTRRAQAVAAGSYARQQAVLLAMARASAERGQAVPVATRDWAARVAAPLLAGVDKSSVERGVELARELRVAEVFEALAGLAGRDSRFGALRVAAIDACVANDARRALPILSAILSDAADNIPQKQKAATSLAAMNLPESRARFSRARRCCVPRRIVWPSRLLAAWPAAPKGANRCWPRSRPVEPRRGC